MVKSVLVVISVWGALTGASAQGAQKTPAIKSYTQIESLRTDLLSALSFLYYLNRVGSGELSELSFAGISINNNSAQSLLPQCTAEDMAMALSENEEIQKRGFNHFMEVAKSKGIEKEVNFQMLAKLNSSAEAEQALNQGLSKIKAEGISWRESLGEIVIPLAVQLDSNLNGQRQPFRLINLLAIPLVSSEGKFSGFRLFLETSEELKPVGTMSFRSNKAETPFFDRSLFIHVIDYELGLRVERLIGIKALFPKAALQILADMPN